MNDGNLPQWAKDRLKADEAMGPPPSMSTIETVVIAVRLVVGLLIIAGLCALGCVVVYVVGRALIGGGA